MGDAGGQGGSQRWGDPRVGRYWRSLTKVGRAQGGAQDGIGRSGAGRVCASPFLNIPHHHHSPPLGDANGPILVEDKSQTLEPPQHYACAPGWMW